MIEVLNVPVQTVAENAALLFQTVAVHSGCAERHRNGGSIVTLTKPGRYLITFSGNIAIPAGGTAGEISVGIAVDGEIIPGTIMRVTPATTGEYFSVSAQTYVNNYCNCCASISVRNTSTQSIDVQDANLTAVRVA